MKIQTKTLTAVVAVFLVPLFVAGCSRSSSHLARPATGASTGSRGDTGTSTKRGTTTTSTATAPRTLQSSHGSGAQDLPPFTVPASAHGWLIHYIYNCANLGQSGNFAIYVENASGDTIDVAAYESGRLGGSTYDRSTTGTYQLSIDSACRWAIEVQTIPL